MVLSDDEHLKKTFRGNGSVFFPASQAETRLKHQFRNEFLGWATPLNSTVLTIQEKILH